MFGCRLVCVLVPKGCECVAFKMKSNTALIFTAVIGLAMAAPAPKPSWDHGYYGDSYVSPVYSYSAPVYTAPVNTYTTYSVGTPEYIPEKTTIYKTTLHKKTVTVPVEYTYEYVHPSHSSTTLYHAPTSYVAPVTSYVAPVTSYVAPVTSYVAPVSTSYVAPVSTYSAPAYSRSYTASHSQSHVHAQENYGGSWK